MTRNILLLLILFLNSACRTDHNASLQPADLLCENLFGPLGIASAAPRLSWENSSRNNGAAQTAYRLIAASGRDLLDKDAGDLWDTGKVESGESIMIPWTGSPLSSRSLVYWKVRTWDEQGVASKWSDPARFSVGLIAKRDWEAEYIGLDHWADCIRPDGGMPHTAPNPYPAGGGPYWCGFIITASWNTCYQSDRCPCSPPVGPGLSSERTTCQSRPNRLH